MTRTAVLGHVEWVEFLQVAHVPRAGEIVAGTGSMSVAAGGGGVAAVALRRWSDDALFFTSLGNDELGHRAATDLGARGVTVHASYRDEPQRRAITLVDAHRERTIIVIGDRHVARAADPLPWHALAACDAVYITGGDADAVRAARAAKIVVSTARILPLLREAGIQLDALVGSDDDAAEVYEPGMLDLEPHLIVRTQGSRGGRFITASGEQRYEPVPTEVTGDTYGAGDTFAAALTYALGAGHAAPDAVAFAAARAAEVVTWRGPYPD